MYSDKKPVLDSTIGIVRMVREEPPAHCIFEVESFSKLKEDNIDSSEFKAAGYTWVLSVYPKGHKQKFGDDHISLFVSMVDELSPGSFVHVMLRFFVYDQLRENFLVVLDARDKLIHADMKSAPGIPKFLPLKTLTRPCNGFLVNDRCVFGAEIFVKDASNIRPFALNLEFSHKDGFNKEICAKPWNYTWRIENFSELKTITYSPVFLIDEWSWSLHLCPREINLGVFLELKTPTKIPGGSTLYTQFQLCLKNQGGQDDHKKTTSTNFPKANTGCLWGFPTFIPISDLRNKGFLVKDVIILEILIEKLLIE